MLRKKSTVSNWEDLLLSPLPKQRVGWRGRKRKKERGQGETGLKGAPSAVHGRPQRAPARPPGSPRGRPAPSRPGDSTGPAPPHASPPTGPAPGPSPMPPPSAGNHRKISEGTISINTCNSFEKKKKKILSDRYACVWESGKREWGRSRDREGGGWEG